MNGKWIFKTIFALVIIAGLVIGGVALYQLGFSQGAMTTLALPEGGEELVAPGRFMYPGWHFGPRVGMLGLFPLLLCLGGFFFLLMMFGFGFAFRKRAWRRHGAGRHHEYWKHHGPPPWGPDRPCKAEDQSKTESESPPEDKEE